MTWRTFTRWLIPRFRPTRQGLPLPRASLCLVCQEVSDGRQAKCAPHTHRIVHLAWYIKLLRAASEKEERAHTVLTSLEKK